MLFRDSHAAQDWITPLQTLGAEVLHIPIQHYPKNPARLTGPTAKTAKLGRVPLSPTKCQIFHAPSGPPAGRPRAPKSVSMRRPLGTQSQRRRFFASWRGATPGPLTENGPASFSQRRQIPGKFYKNGYPLRARNLPFFQQFWVFKI